MTDMKATPEALVEAEREARSGVLPYGPVAAIIDVVDGHRFLERRVAELEAAIRTVTGPFGMPRGVGTNGYVMVLERALSGATPSVSAERVHELSKLRDDVDTRCLSTWGGGPNGSRCKNSKGHEGMHSWERDESAVTAAKVGFVAPATATPGATGPVLPSASSTSEPAPPAGDEQLNASETNVLPTSKVSVTQPSITEGVRLSLAAIFGQTKRLDKISVTLDISTKNLTVTYENLDDEWCLELLRVDTSWRVPPKTSGKGEGPVRDRKAAIDQPSHTPVTTTTPARGPGEGVGTLFDDDRFDRAMAQGAYDRAVATGQQPPNPNPRELPITSVEPSQHVVHNLAGGIGLSHPVDERCVQCPAVALTPNDMKAVVPPVDEGRKSASWMPHGHTSPRMLAYEAAKQHTVQVQPEQVFGSGVIPATDRPLSVLLGVPEELAALRAFKATVTELSAYGHFERGHGEEPDEPEAIEHLKTRVRVLLGSTDYDDVLEDATLTIEAAAKK